MLVLFIFYSFCCLLPYTREEKSAIMKVEIWCKVFSLVLIDMIALCGNFTVILVGYRTRSLRTFQNAFIFNMAFSDFLQGLFIMPSAIINSYYGMWRFGERTCAMFGVLKTLFTLSSVYSLSGISIVRYFYIVKKTPYMNTMKSTVLCIAVSWFISLFLSTTPLFGWGYLGFEDGKEVCTVYFHKSSTHTITVFTTALFLNIVIMTFCYVQIFCKLRSSRSVLNKDDRLTMNLKMRGIIPVLNEENENEERKIPQALHHHHLRQQQYLSRVMSYDSAGSQASSPQILTKRNGQNLSYSNPVFFSKRKNFHRNTIVIPDNVRNLTSITGSVRSLTTKEFSLLKTIFIIIVVFVCCWTPYVLFNTIRTFELVGNINSVDTVTMWLGFLNSATNPVIYGVLNKQFRRGMKKLLCIGCKQKLAKRRCSTHSTENRY